PTVVLFPSNLTPSRGSAPYSTFAIHPFLDGQTPSNGFIFNLSSQYLPMQIVHGQPAFIGVDTLAQPATCPPVSRLKIVCDEIPEWPVVLESHPYSYREQMGTISLPEHPTMSLGNVLSQIHRTLHEEITHSDRERLDPEMKDKVNQAFYKRCANEPLRERFLRNGGIRKVDYLLDKVWFKGLV
ncbi:hypothetical protein F5887DRAFT_867321, partial [Amanita rubescens]